MRYLLYLIFILATNCFGFYSWQFFSIGRNSAGFLLLILINIVCIYNILKAYKKSYYSSLKIPLVLIYFLILFQWLINSIEGVGIKDILSGISIISPLFLVLPFVYYNKSKINLKDFVQFILVVGFLSSLVSIYQFLSGANLNGSTVTEFNETSSRVYHPGGVLMSLCLFIQLSRYFIYGIRRSNTLFYFSIPFYIMGIGVTFHRSLLILLFVGLLIIFIFYFLSGNKFFKLKRIQSLLIISFIAITYISSLSITNMYKDRLEQGKEDISANEGTFAFRFDIITNSFVAVSQENILIGKGFNYNSDMSVFDPLGLTADADYGNVVVNFGFLGLFLWIILYFQMFITTIKLYLKTIEPFFKMLLLAIIPVPVLFIGLGFFGQVMHYTPNLVVLITSFSFVYCIQQLSTRNIKKVKKHVAKNYSDYHLL